MFDINTSNVRWRLAKIGAAPIDRGYITVLTSDQPIGKRITIEDGIAKKHRRSDNGQFIAKAVRCENLEGLGKILRSLKPTQAIVNGIVPSTECLDQFRIVTEAYLREITDTPTDKPRPKAIYIREADGEVLYVGRFKECFVQSRFMFFDRDVVEGMPEHLRTDKFDEWWEQLGILDPQLRHCGSLMIPSASNRAIFKSSGKPAISDLACHVYVQVSDEDADSIGDYNVKMVALAWVKDFGFTKSYETINGQTSIRRYVIFDPSAAGVGRLIYEGSPTVGDGLKVAPLKLKHKSGPIVNLSLLTTISVAELKQKSGLSIRKENGHLVFNAEDLALDTEIDCQTGCRLTITEYLLGEDVHIRCQTPFRNSRSYAAFLGRTRQGVPFLHDVGTQTNHYLDPQSLLFEIKNRFRKLGIDALIDSDCMMLCAALGCIDAGWSAKMKDAAKRERVGKGDFAVAYRDAAKSWTSRWSNHNKEMSLLNTSNNGKQVLWWDRGRVAEITATVRQELGDDPDRHLIFNFAGSPTEIVTETLTDHEVKCKIQPRKRLRRLTPTTIAGKVEAIFQLKTQLNSGEIKNISTPKELKERLAFEYPYGLRPLRGLVSHPFVTPQGEIVITKGYDNESGLYCMDDANYESLGKRLYHEDAVLSYGLLVRHLLADFPFAESEDEAVAVAILLTILCRPLLNIAPGFAISSPNYGSGKTTLARTITAGILGVPAATRAVPPSEEEMQKVILSELMSGVEAILLDNADANREHQSDVLAQILTASTFEGRKLGTNDMISVGTNVTLLATGKNLRFRADLASRFVPCRLKSPLDTSGERKYKHPQPEQWAVKHRSKIIMNGLRILKAFHDADLPQADLEPCRFPQWSDLVRQAIFWVTELDICKGMHEQIEADPESDLNFEFMTAWREKFDNRLIPLRQIDIAILQTSDAPGSDRLLSACQALCPKSVTRTGIRTSVNAQLLSNRLGGFRDQEIGGLILRSTHDPNRKVSSSRAVKYWCVVSKHDDYAVGDVYDESEQDDDESWLD